jgi:hypothetical protein
MKITRQPALLIALATFASSLAPLAAKDTPATGSPIKLWRVYNELIMPVVINGEKGGMGLDTGSWSPFYRKSTAPEIHVSPGFPWSIHNGVGGFTIARTGRVSTVVQGRKQSEFPTLSGDKNFIGFDPDQKSAPGQEIFGFVGLNDLATAGAVVDCGRETVSLYPGGGFKGPKGSPGLQMYRYSPKRAKQWAFVWVVPVKIAGQKVLMIADTGAEFSFLDLDFAKRQGLSLHKDGMKVNAIGGSKTLRVAEVPGLGMGHGVNLGPVSMPTISSGWIFDGHCRDASGAPVQGQVVGVLGMDQMIRMNAVIDCKREVFYVGSKPPGKPSRRPAKSRDFTTR